MEQETSYCIEEVDKDMAPNHFRGIENNFNFMDCWGKL